MLTESSDTALPAKTAKAIHRMALVRRLCASPGLSRSELSDGMQLTKSTVSLLVRELIADGWLVEGRDLVTGTLGRPRTPLFMDPSRLVLLGAELGTSGVRVVIASINGDVLGRELLEYGADRTAPACVATLSAAMLKLCGRLDAARQRVIGIGIGLPGAVDTAQGRLHNAPNLQWRDVPVVGLLARHLEGSALAGLPLFVQNEANVAALGEIEFNGGATSNPLLYLSINRGVGAGVVIDNQVLAGGRGFAGEVGHFVLHVGGPPCSCGRRGCAEVLIGAGALPVDDVHDPVRESRRRLAEGDEYVLGAVTRAGTYLGMLLHNLATTSDPACIVLGGAMVDLGAAFLDPALRTLNDYAAAARQPPPVVCMSRFGVDAVAVGAAALVRFRLTQPAPVPTTMRKPRATTRRRSDWARPRRHPFFIE